MALIAVMWSCVFSVTGLLTELTHARKVAAAARSPTLALNQGGEGTIQTRCKAWNKNIAGSMQTILREIQKKLHKCHKQ